MFVASEFDKIGLAPSGRHKSFGGRYAAPMELNCCIRIVFYKHSAPTELTSKIILSGRFISGVSLLPPNPTASSPYTHSVTALTQF